MKTVIIKNSWFNDSDLRLDASYHLSDGPLTKLLLRNSPYELTTLAAESERIFSGNIFKRSYVEGDKYGWPYLTGSDMVKADIDSGKFISKKYTTQSDNLLIHKDWILISCSGTLGNCVFTNNDFEGRIGTHDLIRIIPNERKLLRGYLYAYLSSKYGYGLLTQFSYGGVVKHIEPHHIQDLPIPILPTAKIQEIHDLIIESANSRVKANRYLKDAQSLVVNAIKFKKRRVSCAVSFKTISKSHQKRFEAQYFTSIGYDIREHIKSGKFKYLKDISKRIFRPGIFKRHYVKNGIEFLGGSDIVKNIPKSEKKLSIAQTKHLNEMKILENWILVTCGGTIGHSVLVNKYLAGKTASQHILRVDSDTIKNGYLYAFMSSHLGLKAIQSFTYGSVIPQIEPHHLGLLPIPLLDEHIMDNAHELVMEYKKFISAAIEKELKAIDLVEKEIESWQI
ncbi:methylation-associated defense system restriction endonuclease subunit S MAD5 [Mucilaginibacter terrae]|uniref:Type I restriction enzyme S subunit n=1 Tax=Mucilaginibacter terrae TaxID=1955052 RepID=A0ABU3GVJ1_9SPHI|nr:restriction endonuclease subunit S [Mucilaginibacter terrae]MDT3403797.1 type I restriction enzyme S subunit [Mucilaginibacter terrae]